MIVISNKIIITQVLTLYLLITTSLQSEILQQTIYDYNNSTLYVRLTNNDLLSIKFNQFFNSTNSSSQISTKLVSSKIDSTITISGKTGDLYAFYSDKDGTMAVDHFNGSIWNQVHLTNTFPFYNYSTYLTTLDDGNKIYIYGGIAPKNTSDITDRILQFDIESGTFSDNITTTVSPTNFYGASNILINYNTQLVIGGKAAAGWVSLQQLAMWQYETWSFKSVTNYDGINSRKFAQLLPIFSKEGSHDIVENQQGSSSAVNIDGLISLGGELINNLASPNVLKLNVTGGNNNGWSWSSLDDELNIELGEILGSCVIYETFITFTKSSKNKRANDDKNGYNMNLYDVSNNVGAVNAVDYAGSTIKTLKSKSSSNNKSVVIAVAVVVPVLVIILIAAAWFFYIKWKKNRDPTNNYESFDIMDFYNNHSKKSSLAFNHDEVKVNDYDDNDNLSISSWRRKREEFERANNYKKKPVRNLPQLPTLNMMELSQQQQQQEPVVPQRNQSVLKKSLSTFSKTFSLSGAKSMKKISKIEEETEYDNLKSRSTLDFVDESPYKLVNDSRSIFSNSTYFEDSESPTKHSQQSPFLNSNRFSDLTILLNNNNTSDKLIPDHDPDLGDDDDDDDADADIDVQVLVSSKRRSKLRVMNPDEPEEEFVLQHQRKNPSVVPEVDDENELYINDLFEVIGDLDYDDVGDNGTRKRVVSGDGNNVEEV